MYLFRTRDTKRFEFPSGFTIAILKHIEGVISVLKECYTKEMFCIPLAVAYLQNKEVLFSTEADEYGSHLS